jgi:RHS repeat-associated protein
MIVDKSGSLAGVRRHDYLPFGEELAGGAPSAPGVGGRTTTQGYMNDSERQKFSGYEYDAETGLNYAQARYQSPTQGRFTSVDPLMASASTTRPQSFNRYSHALNNPLRFVDASGMASEDADEYFASNRAESDRQDNVWRAEVDAARAAARRQQQRQQAPPAAPPPTQPPPVSVPQSSDWPPSSPPWLSGPIPLAPGVAPVPTALVPIEGPNQVYNGNSVISPTGTVVNGQANYGRGRVIDYLILDQGGNPMGPETGVTFTEVVSSPNLTIQTAINNGVIGTSNYVPQSPESNGTVFDTQGAISHSPNSLNANSTFSVNQTITIGMPNPGNPGHPRNYIQMKNTIQVTPGGATINFGKPGYFTQR